MIANALIAFVLPVILAVLALRKVLIAVATLQDNAGSFTNLTGDTLHVRKVTLRVGSATTNWTLGDTATASLDEIPSTQDFVNDSRSHILGVELTQNGATGSLDPAERIVHLEFNRNDLILRPDEALFLNTTDISGAPTMRTKCQIYYEAL